MKAPAVSVVVPAYNAAAFLAKTLETVSAQTFRDWELIVVDDGSQDATATVAREFIAARGLRGDCISQPNKRIAGARNTGVKASSGGLIAFLDHDDLWLPEKLAAVMEEFSRRPEADLVCHNENVVKDGRVVAVTRNGPEEPAMYERLLFRGNALSPSAVTVKREKVLEVGGFRENPEFNTVEDYDLWMRLSRVCRFHFLDRVLGEYQLVERGASNKVVYHHTNLERLLEDHFRAYCGDNPSLGMRLRVRRRLAAVYRSAARALLAQGDARSAGAYARRALGSFPLDWKNAAVAGLWLARNLAP